MLLTVPESVLSMVTLSGNFQTAAVCVIEAVLVRHLPFTVSVPPGGVLASSRYGVQCGAPVVWTTR